MNNEKSAAKNRLFIFIILIVVLLFSIFLNIYILVLDNRVSARSVGIASKIFGLDFTAKERKMMVRDVKRNQSRYAHPRQQRASGHRFQSHTSWYDIR